jgi:hypothetical protein
MPASVGATMRTLRTIDEVIANRSRLTIVVQ